MNFHYATELFSMLTRVANTKVMPFVKMKRVTWKDGVNTGIIYYEGVPHKITIEPIKTETEVKELTFNNVMKEIENG